MKNINTIETNTTTKTAPTTIADALTASGHGTGNTSWDRIIRAEVAKAETARREAREAELAREARVEESFARLAAKREAEKAEAEAKAYAAEQEAKAKEAAVPHRVAMRDYEVILGTSPAHRSARTALLTVIKRLKADDAAMAYTTPDGVETMFRAEWARLGWTHAARESWLGISRNLEELKKIFA